jgi:hypothetical protein
VLVQRDKLMNALKAAFAIADLEWRFQGAHPHRLAVLNEMEDALDSVLAPTGPDMTKDRATLPNITKDSEA